MCPCTSLPAPFERVGVLKGLYSRLHAVETLARTCRSYRPFRPPVNELCSPNLSRSFLSGRLLDPPLPHPPLVDNPLRMSSRGLFNTPPPRFFRQIVYSLGCRPATGIRNFPAFSRCAPHVLEMRLFPFCQPSFGKSPISWILHSTVLWWFTFFFPVFFPPL